jgi:hypothetical protein
MGETKFTPWPWEVRNGTDVFSATGGESGDGRVADDCDGWQVADCSVGLTSVGGELESLSIEVQQANAHLTAAAPDLFEALEELEDLTMGLTDRSNGLPSAELERARERVRAALAKARGETP